MIFHAHTKHNTLPESWEPLFSAFGEHDSDCQDNTCEKCFRLEPMHGHINKVAYWTGKFAAEMFSPDSDEASAAREWGRLAGLWHDLGKFSYEFQERLRGERARVDHSTAGAQYSFEKFPVIGQLFAYWIAGHHTGLTDWNKNASNGDLARRLQNVNIPSWEQNVPSSLLDQTLPPRLSFLSPSNDQDIAFFSRLLFSCVVDADYLATEAFMTNARFMHRAQWPADILEKMEEALGIYYRSFDVPEYGINYWRNIVRNDCLTSADRPPGLFTLTVPTGGGKTLSSLSFALRHAIVHGLRRVIYVVPYTSIIEQNAEEFRKALHELTEKLPTELGSNLVLEHHSNFESDEEFQDDVPLWQLTAENWDSPLIVTTSVQFFESFYANRTSRCRKLHNIARSVIIVDEAQNIPVSHLAPCLEVFRQLENLAGASVVLCTATQPAIGKRSNPEDSFNRIALNFSKDREIVRDVPSLFNAFRRVDIEREESSLPDEDLAARLKEHSRVLCIVNTKIHAAHLLEALGLEDSANIHLSAQLCPAHRQAILVEIKRRERENKPCRLISTTVVEAGVNIDFPIVYRALTGLDSLAQAAGRCNRHGKLTNEEGKSIFGRTILFIPVDHKTPGFLTDNTNSTSQVIDSHNDLLSPEAIEHYFRMHYWMSGGENGKNWDKHEILSCFRVDQSATNHPFGFNFKTAAQNFQMIPDTQLPVIIEPIPNLWTGQNKKNSDEICKLIEDIRDSHTKKYPPPAGAHRRLQRYTVQIPKAIHAGMLAHGIIQSYHDKFWILTHPENDYDPKLGLLTNQQDADATAFMV